MIEPKNEERAEALFLNDRVIHALRIQVQIDDVRSRKLSGAELEPLLSSVEFLLRRLVAEVGAT